MEILLKLISSGTALSFIILIAIYDGPYDSLDKKLDFPAKYSRITQSFINILMSSTCLILVILIFCFMFKLHRFEFKRVVYNLIFETLFYIFFSLISLFSTLFWWGKFLDF